MNSSDPAIVECGALHLASKLAAECGWTKVAFESDSATAISAIYCENNLWKLEGFCDSMSKFWNDFPLWSFCYVNKTANNAAHLLTQWCVSLQFCGQFPCNGLPLLVQESLVLA